MKTQNQDTLGDVRRKRYKHFVLTYQTGCGPTAVTSDTPIVWQQDPSKMCKKAGIYFLFWHVDKLLINRTHDMEAHSLCSSCKAKMTGLVGNKLFSSSSFLPSSRHTLVLMSQGLVNEFSPTFCINPSIKMSSFFFFFFSRNQNAFLNIWSKYSLPSYRIEGPFLLTPN